MSVYKFANVISKLYGRRFPEIKKEKGRKHLLGPKFFIWNILEKSILPQSSLYLSVFSSVNTVDSSSFLNSAENVWIFKANLPTFLFITSFPLCLFLFQNITSQHFLSILTYRYVGYIFPFSKCVLFSFSTGDSHLHSACGDTRGINMRHLPIYSFLSIFFTEIDYSFAVLFSHYNLCHVRVFPGL